MASRKPSKVKLILVSVGTAACVAAATLSVIAYFSDGSASAGPSELTLHPERESEVLAKRRAARAQDELGLRPEQTKQLQTVLADFRASHMQARQENSGNLLGMIAARREQFDELDARIMSILDEEQVEKYEALRDTRRTGMQQFFRKMMQRRQEEGRQPGPLMQHIMRHGGPFRNAEGDSPDEE